MMKTSRSVSSAFANPTRRHPSLTMTATSASVRIDCVVLSDPDQLARTVCREGEQRYALFVIRLHQPVEHHLRELAQRDEIPLIAAVLPRALR
jgi:hypothetical protein